MMQYNGGKGKVARELAAAINLFKPQVYWEPFVGAGNVIQYINAPVRIGSDFCPHIIHYLKLISSGWNPPDLIVTESLYREWKSRLPRTPEEFAIKAMIGYGCSFGGKWFGGLARDKRKDTSNSFYQTAQIAGRKQSALVREIRFEHQSFLDKIPSGVDLIYADPPYKGTTIAGMNRKFDSNIFWNWCLACAHMGIRVLVTEFSAPDFAQEIWNKKKASDLKQVPTQMVERLFWVRP